MLQDTMQHAAWTFDTSDIPWILQNLLFSQTSFWREDFFNISNHLPDSSFAYVANLTFDLANSCPGWQIYSLWGLLFHFHRSVGS